MLLMKSSKEELKEAVVAAGGPEVFDDALKSPL
jgi:hypothetical protein